MFPNTPERAALLPSFLYSSPQCELTFSDPSSSAPLDDDWGIKEGFTCFTSPRRNLKSEAEFERLLCDARSPKAPPVDKIRGALVKRCQRMHKEYVRERKADPKRIAIEERLKKLAAQQVVDAERMITDFYKME